MEEENEFVFSDTDVTFSNEQLKDIDLPLLATLEYSPLEKNLQKGDMIFNLIFFLVPLIILLVLKYIVEIEWLTDNGIYILIGILSLMGLTLLYTYYEFYQKSYAIREKDIIYNKGLFWKSSIVIPFNRVQHCEVSQGPIDRWLNLSELKIFTAGGASSDLVIQGLLPPTANRIKDFIVQKTGIDEEE